MTAWLRLRNPLRTLAALVVAAGACVALMVLTGCSPTQAELEAVGFAPERRADWAVSTPAEQGLDPLRVARLYHDAARQETVHSLLVVKNGVLVAEDYFNGGGIDRKDRLQSMTKSVTSSLVGIALAQGCLSSVDQKMVDFFPEWAGRLTDPRKRLISLRLLLQMRGGYPNEESAGALWEGLLSGRYVPLVEAFPLVSDPGSRFHYSNLSSNWLGIIVDRGCGMPIKAFAEQHLFGPLGIEPGEWSADHDGHNNGCCDLHLRARDAARFGMLYLREGAHRSRQVVPANWVRDSLATYSVNEAFVTEVGRLKEIGYGYQWWSARVDGHRVNMAWGHGGQLIVLVRELDLMVVVTAYPFWLEHNADSWRHESAIMEMVGEFIHAVLEP